MWLGSIIRDALRGICVQTEKCYLLREELKLMLKSNS